MTQSDRTGARAAMAGASRVTIAEPAWRVPPAAAPEVSSAPTTDARGDRERPLARVNGRADAPDSQPDSQAAAALPDRDGVRRVFDERTGDEWRVFERDATHIPGARGARCLFFDGEGIVRRVWRYPADWSTLPSASLLALMEQPPLGDDI